MSARRTAIFAALAVSLATGLAAAPARAAESDTNTVNVSLAGINLASPHGQAVLRQRVKTAVDNVCGSADLRDLSAMADMQKCRADAMLAAHSQAQIAMANYNARPTGTALASR